MTAETLTATRAASTFPVYRPTGSGMVAAAYGTYYVAANVEDGDIFEMCRIPAGAVIIGGWVYGNDIETNATPQLDIDLGWATNGGSGTYDTASVSGLGNYGTWGGTGLVKTLSAETGNIFPLAGVLADGKLPNFTKETVIQLEANAAASTFTAGHISVVVLYVVP